MVAWRIPPVRCCRCAAALPEESISARESAICPACNSDVVVRVFPAIFNAPGTISAAETAAGEGEATCFFHPGKTALTPCSRCGRFLCQLCKVELHGEDWCPECLSSGMKKQKIATLENRRVLYDSIALALATLPVMTVWLSAIGAPAAIFVAIRYWKAPASIVRRTKWRFVAAIALGLTEIALWVWVVVYLTMLAKTKT